VRLVACLVVLFCCFAAFVSIVRILRGDNVPIVLGELVCIVAIGAINIGRIRRDRVVNAVRCTEFLCLPECNPSHYVNGRHRPIAGKP
jgi:hypothetical protein